MKFYNYINENIYNWEEVREQLLDNCLPVLKDLKKSRAGSFMYIGKKDKIKHYKIKKTRKNRKPKDTPYEVHEILDDLFYRKFGIKARSQTIFATGYIVEADQYGNVYLMFPIGRYEIIWSPDIQDLWGFLEDSDLLDYLYDDTSNMIDSFEEDFEYDHGIEYVELENNEYEKDQREYVERRIEEWKENKEEELNSLINEYRKGSIKNAINSKNEIMVKCDEYMLVEVQYENDILNLIRKDL